MLYTYQNLRKWQKIFFGPVTSTEKCLKVTVKHYIRVKIFFFTMGAYWVSKDAEFYVQFKNVNLPLYKIASKKNYWRKKIR